MLHMWKRIVTVTSVGISFQLSSLCGSPKDHTQFSTGTSCISQYIYTHTQVRINLQMRSTAKHFNQDFFFNIDIPINRVTPQHRLTLRSPHYWLIFFSINHGGDSLFYSIPILAEKWSQWGHAAERRHSINNCMVWNGRIWTRVNITTRMLIIFQYLRILKCFIPSLQLITTDYNLWFNNKRVVLFIHLEFTVLLNVWKYVGDYRKLRTDWEIRIISW